METKYRSQLVQHLHSQMVSHYFIKPFLLQCVTLLKDLKSVSPFSISHTPIDLWFLRTLLCTTITNLPFESLSLLHIALQSWMSCLTCSNNASCCLFNFWKNVSLFFILFVVSSLIQFLNASRRSFSFSINRSCCICASRNLLSNSRIFSLHSVPSWPFLDTLCQLCTSVLICTWNKDI